MIQLSRTKRLLATTGAALLFAGGVMAGDAKCVVIDDKCPVECCLEDPGFCKFFDYSTLYNNENNCLIQKVAFAGRYHGQYLSQSLDFTSPGATFDAGGNHYWEHRRFRFGAKVQFLNDFTFFNNWNVADNSGVGRNHFFNDIYEMYIKWEPSDFTLGSVEGFYVTVGKQKAHITREWTESSKRILTVERSHITNEVSDIVPWGIAFGFEHCDIDHELGLWVGGYDNSNGFGGTHPRWPGFDSRYGISYRGSKELNDHTTAFFDYFFTNNNGGLSRPRTLGPRRADEDALPNYNHVFALGTENEWDIGICDRKFGLLTDVIYALDREAQNGNALGIAGGNNNRAAGDDTFGFVLLPYYDLTERLQLVGRYAYATDARLHRTQRRVFDNTVALGGRPNLEDVHTFYAGFNYRLCGDNLKLLGGYEYLSADLHEAAGSAELGGLRGHSWMIGVRTYW